MKKLTLKKETIVNLNNEEMNNLRGGAIDPDNPGQRTQAADGCRTIAVGNCIRPSVNAALDCNMTEQQCVSGSIATNPPYESANNYDCLGRD